MLIIIEQNLGQPVHVDDWIKLVRVLGGILSDIRSLDSLKTIIM